MAKIVTKKTGRPAEIKEIELTLENMQRLVGGLIEAVYLEDCILWCNDEGKLMDLPVNIVLTDKKNKSILDVVAGDVFFTSLEDDEGSETDIDDEVAKRLVNQLDERKLVFTRIGGEMNMTPYLEL